MNTLIKKLQLKRALYSTVLKQAFHSLERETVYCQLIEIPTFRSPIGISIRKNGNAATVEFIEMHTGSKTLYRQRAVVDSAQAQQLFVDLEGLSLKPNLKASTLQGRDGSEFELTIGTAGKGTTSYQWLNCETPDHWKPLDELVDRIQAIAQHTKVAPTEIPYTFTLELDESAIAVTWNLTDIPPIP